MRSLHCYFLMFFKWCELHITYLSYETAPLTLESHSSLAIKSNIKMSLKMIFFSFKQFLPASCKPPFLSGIRCTFKWGCYCTSQWTILFRLCSIVQGLFQTAACNSCVSPFRRVVFGLGKVMVKSSINDGIIYYPVLIVVEQTPAIGRRGACYHHS